MNSNEIETGKKNINSYRGENSSTVVILYLQGRSRFVEKF